MKIHELMTRDVATVRPGATLAEAARLMWEGDFGCVPVVDVDRSVIGMITDRDICMAGYTRGLALHEICVDVAMAHHVTSCLEDDLVEAAEALMRSHVVRRLPVVDRAGHLVGLLSMNDLARHAQLAGTGRAEPLAAGALAQLLASVSTPTLHRATS